MLSQKQRGKLNSFHWRFKLLGIPNVMVGMISKSCNKGDQLKKENLLLNDPIHINFLLENFFKVLPNTEFLADSTVIKSFLGTHRNNSSAYRKGKMHRGSVSIYMIRQMSQIYILFKLQVVWFLFFLFKSKLFWIKILPSFPLQINQTCYVSCCGNQMSQSALHKA